MDSIVIIPARGGSKGIPGKNIKLLGGKPLIQYTIEAAQGLFDNNQIIVSTDDNIIKDCVEQIGLKVPYIRPADLASDLASTYGVLLHGISYLEENDIYPDVLIFLQATSPFRTTKHINEALEIYKNQTDIDMVVSVSETKANPYYVLFEETKEGFLKNSKIGNFSRRQDCPKVWQYNGAIYVINVNSLKKRSFLEFKKVKKYEMDELSSLDIDTNIDWLLAESIIRSGNYLFE